MPDTFPPFASEPLKLEPGLSAADRLAACKSYLQAATTVLHAKHALGVSVSTSPASAQA